MVVYLAIRYEVARRIRGMEEDACGGVGEGRRVPILAHTALGSRAESLKSGMDAVVTKPIEEEAFVRALMDAFGHSGSVRPRHRKETIQRHEAKGKYASL